MVPLAIYQSIAENNEQAKTKTGLIGNAMKNGLIAAIGIIFLACIAMAYTWLDTM